MFSHFPSNYGCGTDNVASDWWRYFVEPALALTPDVPCQASPAIEINYSDGQSGSFFTITGTNFPPNNTGDVIVNGHLLFDALNVDNSGAFVVTLNTERADIGNYAVTIEVNPILFTEFTINPNAPFRSQEGNTPVIIVPNGIVQNEVYLPFVQK